MRIIGLVLLSKLYISIERSKISNFIYFSDQLKDVLNTDRYYYGRKPISAELSLYIYLEFIGNTEPLRKVSHLFDVTISSVFRVTRRVTSWLHSLMDDIIRWPNGEEVRANERFFRGCSGINKIVASIDGTQVRTIKPRENHQSYFNRKKSYSVNLQAEVDAKRRFISVYAGEPGSQHDARVFRRSPLYRLSNVERERYFPDDSFLVGDSAYPSTSYLVTPFRDNGRLTADQIDFNEKISKARVIVENAFAMLKGRFRRLKFFTEFLRIEFLTDLIIAACILHNICVDSDDDGNDFFEVDEELGNDEEMIENDMNGRPQVDPNINLEQEHDRRRDELFRSMYP